MGMGNGGVNGTNVSSTVLSPNFTLFTGTPTYVANMRVRSNAPSNLAENETKIEILKRQQICLSQVSKLSVFICWLNNIKLLVPKLKVISIMNIFLGQS